MTGNDERVNMDGDLQFWAVKRHRCSRRKGLRAILMFMAACVPLHKMQVNAAGLSPEICASMSSASGASLTLATAGITHSFTITARDDSGIPVSLESGSTFVVRLHDKMARASIHQTPRTEKYVGSYDASVSGIDKLSLLLAKCE